VIADAQQVFKDSARVAGRLQRLRQDDEVKALVGIVDEVAVGVALDHREAACHAFVDAALRDLDAAAVDGLLAPQQLKQFAVAAADVEHARAGGDEAGHHLQVDTGCSVDAHSSANPLARAAERRKPRIAPNSSGSSSRKASWPRSVSISTKETDAPAALSACTIERFSSVGNSQSLVKETTQKRVVVLVNASARVPPWSAAR